MSVRSLQSTCVMFFFFQAEDGIRDVAVTGVQTCALPISRRIARPRWRLPRKNAPRRCPWSSWQHRAAAAATGCDTPLGPQRHRHALSFHALARAGFAAERHVRRDARRRRAVHGGLRKSLSARLQILGASLERCRRLKTTVDRKSTRLNSSHGYISYAVFCLKKKKHNKYKLQSQQIHTNEECE